MGDKYTTRLEYLIKGLNWVNDIAVEKGCDTLICAGDMMDRATLDDIEITALKELTWKLPCYFLVGNHESKDSSLLYTSVKALESDTNIIINRPYTLETPKAQIHFVPYIVESDRKPLTEYLLNVDNSKKQIIVSHNDLCGINYAGFVSQTGFKLDEIEACCDLYLNGHLHNSERITNKILNLGSMSAHNFTNDSLRYKYGIWILDTDNFTIDFIENPYSLNFYKLDIVNAKDIKKLDTLKNQAILSIKCLDKLIAEVRTKIDAMPNVLTYRLIPIISLEEGTKVVDNSSLLVDHLAKFIECCKEKLEPGPVLDAELQEICK
jgi:DNA repair exonuclease SbcCD nuclease subunit